MRDDALTLNVIGAGRVGRTLARRFQQAGVCRVQDLCSRDPVRAADAVAFIGAGQAVTTLAAMRPAQLWMLSVPDTVIEPVAAGLASLIGAAVEAGVTPPIVFHCSGYWPASALEPLRRLGWSAGSVHPVRSFADPAIAVAAFDDTPCGLEGDEAALAVLTPLFEAINGRCFQVPGERKALYHAAAVFASNFTVVLQSLAHDAWRDAGVPEEMAWRIQASLVRGTVDNVFQLGPAAAITGPAARGDTAVVRHQGEVVAGWHPEAGQVYRDLSALAGRLARQRSTRPLPAGAEGPDAGLVGSDGGAGRGSGPAGSFSTDHDGTP